MAGNHVFGRSTVNHPALPTLKPLRVTERRIFMHSPQRPRCTHHSPGGSPCPLPKMDAAEQPLFPCATAGCADTGCHLEKYCDEESAFPRRRYPPQSQSQALIPNCHSEEPADAESAVASSSFIRRPSSQRPARPQKGGQGTPPTPPIHSYPALSYLSASVWNGNPVTGQWLGRASTLVSIDTPAAFAGATVVFQPSNTTSAFSPCSSFMSASM